MLFDIRYAILQEGDVVAGRYQLVRTLSSRESGSVWGARDIRLGRAVAIMFMASVAPRASACSRFTRKVRAAAVNLRPAEHGFHEGLPYIVMELRYAKCKPLHNRRGTPAAHMAADGLRRANGRSLRAARAGSDALQACPLAAG